MQKHFSKSKSILFGLLMVSIGGVFAPSAYAEGGEEDLYHWPYDIVQCDFTHTISGRCLEIFYSYSDAVIGGKGVGDPCRELEILMVYEEDMFQFYNGRTPEWNTYYSINHTFIGYTGADSLPAGMYAYGVKCDLAQYYGTN